ncbi:MAG: FKBP-type peptidyl-prolyl cis-trans isomerase [Candidatus Kariarchaeaceae archaeon]|jgi:hypothetical protein
MRKSLLSNTFLLILLVSPLLISSPVTTHAYTECDGVESGDVALVSYTGTIQGGDRDGEQFDTGNQVQFTIASGSLIEGFYEGMLGMKIGERKTIVVPPSKGYSTGDLAGQTLNFEVFLDAILQGARDCDDGGEGTGFGSTLGKIFTWIAGIGVVAFVGYSLYLITQKQTTADCVHCKTEGRDRLSDGKCGKCGNHYCRQSFSRGCPNCKSNTFVPNK